MGITPDEVLEKIKEGKRNNSTELDLSSCKLTRFPLEILELTNLTKLISQLTRY